MTLYEQLLEDLAAEQAALDAVLGGITDTQWDLPIPSVPHAGRRRLRLGCIRRRDLPRSAMLRPHLMFVAALTAPLDDPALLLVLAVLL